MNPSTVSIINVRERPANGGVSKGKECGPRFPFTEGDITWEEALREAHKYLPHAEAAFPRFVEELCGIAEGADVPFEEVWLLNCYEEVTENCEVSACTCLAVRDDLTADGHALLAHNEDWISVDRDHVYLIHAEPDDGPAFISITYGALLSNIGFNKDGIGVAINSVYPTDLQTGVQCDNNCSERR